MSKDLKQIERFLHNSFNVAGTVKARKGVAVVTDTKDGFWTKGLLFEIKDDVRGTFHVGIFDEKAKDII